MITTARFLKIRLKPEPFFRKNHTIRMRLGASRLSCSFLRFLHVVHHHANELMEGATNEDKLGKKVD